MPPCKIVNSSKIYDKTDEDVIVNLPEKEVIVNLPENLDELIRKSTDIDDDHSPKIKEKYYDSDGEKQEEVVSSEENMEFETNTVIFDPEDFLDPETETVIEYELGSDSCIVQNECLNITEDDEEKKVKNPINTQISHETVADDLDINKVPQLSRSLSNSSFTPHKPIVKEIQPINDRLKVLVDEQFYDGLRLEKLSKRMKILPQVFDVAKDISAIKKENPNIYKMKQFDVFNYTYDPELRHRFELNKKKGFNTAHNVHLMNEAKRYETQDAKMLSYVREIYKTCKLLCNEYGDMDFC